MAINNQSRSELTYEWTAKYNDDTELKQYDDLAGEEHHFGHIDQDKIREFVLNSTKGQKLSVGVNLYNGLFYINNKPVDEIEIEGKRIRLGLFFGKRIVKSSWGNKAKLIYLRHVRRDFVLSENKMNVTITYEIGWEADVEGKHEKHTILIDDKGNLLLPVSPEQEGFSAL
jgi:hypothetical protein